MKNYTIIEDLDSQFYQTRETKNYAQLLFQCFIRNFLLIKKYSYSSNELLLSNLKKKIIPKYIQEIIIYQAKLQEKHRKMYYNRRKISQEDFYTHRKSKNTSIGMIKNYNYKQNDKINSDVKQKKLLKLKSQPSLVSEFFQNQKEQRQKTQHNQELKNQIVNYKTFQLVKNQQKTNLKTTKQALSDKKTPKHSLTDNKIQASIYNDCINYNKKLLFQTTLTKISRTRQQRNIQQLIEQKQIKKNRISLNSSNQQNILQKKIINILKQKKSINKFKFKLFSTYLLNKNLFKKQENKQNSLGKDNFQLNIVKNFNNTHSLNHSYSFNNKQGQNKVSLINLALKGKYILTNKHKFSNSCTFQTLNQQKNSNFNSTHNNKKILQKISNNIIHQDLPNIKSVERLTKSKRNRQRTFKENGLEKYKKQKLSEKSFSLPKF